jgi:hypothetical protein
MPQIGKGDPRVFLQHPLRGDAEPGGARSDLFDRFEIGAAWV